MTIFDDDDDFASFEKALSQAVERSRMRLLAYCLMPNHWHLVVWPRNEGDLSRFVGWLTLTHTQRWHAQRHSTGSGHVYQAWKRCQEPIICLLGGACGRKAESIVPSHKIPDTFSVPF